MKGTRLSPGEFSLLTVVKNNTGISQTALANAYDLDKSTLSHAVRGMVDKRLIIRNQSTEGQRYYGMKLSYAGNVLLRKVTSIIENKKIRWLVFLTSSVKAQFLNVLIRISIVLARGPQG